MRIYTNLAGSAVMIEQLYKALGYQVDVGANRDTGPAFVVCVETEKQEQGTE